MPEKALPAKLCAGLRKPVALERRFNQIALPKKSGRGDLRCRRTGICSHRTSGNIAY